MTQSWRTTQNADDWVSEYREAHKGCASSMAGLLALLAGISLVCGYLIALITR